MSVGFVVSYRHFMENQQKPTRNYDYTRLNSRVTIRDMLAVIQSKVTKPVFYSYLFLMSVFVFVATLVLVLSMPALLSGQFGQIAQSVIMVVIILIVVRISRRHLQVARQQVRLRAFAAVNGFSYLGSANTSIDTYNGMMMNEGHTRTIYAGIRSTLGIQYELANCSYTTGAGKNSRTYYYGFIRIKLPRRLPHMVLDATANNTFGRFSNLPLTFREGQKLSLEGDFDKYFTLYAPAEYKTDALYVFTPDVMQLFIGSVHTFDAEIVDDDLYLYSPRLFELDTPASLQALLDLIDNIYPKIYNQSSYYADSRVGERAVNDIAPQGARLKSRISYVAIAIIVCIMLILILPTLMRLVELLGTA